MHRYPGPDKEAVPASAEEVVGTTRQYQCTVCAKSYRYQQGLDKHQRLVHKRSVKSKLYCALCGASFHELHRVKAHMKDAHGAQRLVCIICGVSFKHKRSLQSHLKSKHSDDVESRHVS